MSTTNGYGPDPSKEEIKNLISKNMLVSLLANAFYLVTRLFIPPLTLAHVSLDEYGIWSACFVVIAYLGMGAFGISNSYIRYVGIFQSKRDSDAINRLLTTGLTLTLAGAAVVILVVWLGMPALLGFFSIPPELHPTAFALFFGTVCVFMLELSFGAFAYVLIGLQRIVAEKIVWVAAFCLEALLIVAFLLMGWGIYALLWAFVLRYLFSVSANVWLCRRALPELSLRAARFDKKFIKYFLHFGGIVQLNGIIGMILGSVERLIAGYFLNTRAVALFDLGQKFPRMAVSVPGSLTQAIFPAATHLQQENRREEIGKLYLKSSRYINLMTGVLMGFMSAFSFGIMTAWLGRNEDYHLAATLMLMFTLPFQIHITTGPATAIFKGLGRPQGETVYPAIKLVLVLVFTYLAYQIQGWTVLGIGVAVAASLLLSAGLFLIYANRELAVSQWVFFYKVMLPGLVPYPVGLVFWYLGGSFIDGLADQRWSQIPWLALIGFVYTLICCLILWFLFCDWRERQFLQRQLKSVLKTWVAHKKHGHG